VVVVLVVEEEEERERTVCLCVCEREFYKELSSLSITGGLGRRPRPDSAMSPLHHATVCFPTHTWRSNSLHGEDFPRTLMRGSPDGTMETDRHRQETLDLVA